MHKLYHWKKNNKLSRSFFIKVVPIITCCLFLFFWLEKLIIINNYIQLELSQVFNDYSFYQKLSIIEVNGNKNLSEQDILAISGLHLNENLLTINLDKIKFNIMQDNRIKLAEVQRIWPNKIVVRIKEEEPFAVWVHDKRFFLINELGKIIYEEKERKLSNRYIAIFGEHANIELRNIYPSFVSASEHIKIRSAALISGRRWNIYTSTNVLILLPEYDPGKALKKAIEVLECKKYGAIKKIDLRLFPEKIFLQASSLDHNL